MRSSAESRRSSQPWSNPFPDRLAPQKASLEAFHAPRAVVVGFGRPAAGDASAGLQVARVLRDVVPPGVRVVEGPADLAALLEAWADAPLAILVDAVRTGAPAGVISRVEVLPGARPALAGLQLVATPSTRGRGLDEAVSLGRALGRLPKRLVIVTIEGGAPDASAGMSEDVRQAVKAAARSVLSEVLQR